ncbi:alpha/beta hydrolase [Adhaeribacter swui]|uniref:Alpha/beta hydrolase n=1 Tax=Adhaeribacter swui TaxID=2086471 RepID=A0A7G7G4T9_9BACT|nr:alpha/beta hydrolase [Adhaeribacter swui]QNF32173.1 alpha/beta hydrolase [Adhaeribacter swui]
MTLTQKTYAVNNVQLQVTTAGEAHHPVILFLHGFPEMGLSWRQQLLFFAEQGFYAIAPDQRGYNRSSKPSKVKDYTLPHLTADIAALIQQLTPGQVYLAGHDWGGAVVWSLALHYPELIHKLIILNMPHPVVLQQQLKKSGKQRLRSWYAGFFQVPVLPELLCRAFNFKILESSVVKTALPRTFSRQTIALYKKAWQQPGALRAMINWYRAYKYDPLTNKEKITVPTLLLWGKKDKFLSSEMAQPSINQCNQGRLEFLDNATHWLHHEQPSLVNNLILDFVKTESPS